MRAFPAVRPRPLTAFLWGWATALVALACLVVVVLGILSAVQVGSMSSKLPGLPIIVVGVIGFAAFLGTLLGAASMVVCACVARWHTGHSLELSLIAAVALCGAVVAALTVGTFSALNAASISLPALGGWFAADVVANVAMLFGAKVYADKMSLAQISEQVVGGLLLCLPLSVQVGHHHMAHALDGVPLLGSQAHPQLAASSFWWR